MKSVSAIVEEILTPFLETNELELYDLAFVKEGPNRFLRVFIDSQQGVGLKECELVSKFLSAELDENDPIKGQYYLEVRSPGIERVLKKDEHYQKYLGDKIQVNLYKAIDSHKRIKGKLLLKDQDKVKILDDRTNKEIEIPMSLISKATNIVEF